MGSGLPEIHDEAPPTPPWVMLLGVALLFAALAAALYKITLPEETKPAAPPAADAGPEAAPTPPPEPSPERMGEPAVVAE